MKHTKDIAKRGIMNQESEIRKEESEIRKEAKSLYEMLNYDELWLLRNAARDSLRYTEEKIQEINKSYQSEARDYVLDFTIKDYYALVNLALEKCASPTMSRGELLKVIQPRVIG